MLIKQNKIIKLGIRLVSGLQSNKTEAKRVSFRQARDSTAQAKHFVLCQPTIGRIYQLLFIPKSSKCCECSTFDCLVELARGVVRLTLTIGWVFVDVTAALINLKS